MKYIGIDIDSYSVKIAEVSPNSTSGELTKYTEFKISQDPNANNRLEVIDILRNFTSKFNPGETHFIVGIDQSYVTHRHLTFPFKERYNIQKSLAFELEDSIPLSLDNGVFEAKITSYEPEQTNVLASATSKEHVIQTLELCKDAGFDPYIISTRALAFSNIFENWVDPPIEKSTSDVENRNSQAHIILNIGYEDTMLLMYVDDDLTCIRSFSWGVRYIAEDLAIKYQIPLSESLKELKAQGYILVNKDDATSDQIVFSETLQKSIDKFAHDLTLTFLELKSKFNLDIEKCSLAGGAAYIKNIGPYFTQKLEVTSNSIKTSLNQVANKAATYSSVTGSVALGLAIEGLKKPRNPAINFLKGEFAKKNESFELFWQKWNFSLKVATACFALLVVFGFLREQMALTISEESELVLKDQAKSVAGISGRRAVKQTKKYIHNQELRAKNIKEFEQLSQVTSALDIIKDLSSKLPSKKQLTLDVRRLNIKNTQVTISGLVNRTDSLKILKDVLKQYALKNKITSLNSRLLAPSGKKSFSYKFSVSRKKGHL